MGYCGRRNIGVIGRAVVGRAVAKGLHVDQPHRAAAAGLHGGKAASFETAAHGAVGPPCKEAKLFERDKPPCCIGEHGQ